MKSIKIGLLLLMLLGSLMHAQQSKPRLAILPFTGGGGGDGETIAELFSFERSLAQGFTLIPRTSSVETLMKEQQFQRSSGLTDSDTIARLGRQYNADFVVAGHIRTLGAKKLILITIIQVETLQQIAGDYREYTSIEEVQGFIPAMAKRISEASRRDTAQAPKLAALPFALSAPGVNQEEAEVLAQLLATNIANSGKYGVLPRTSTIEMVMKEHQIQRSGITEQENIKLIGKALNAEYVLVGNVRRLGQANIFTAQILHVEGGTLVVGDAVNYQVSGDGLTKMKELWGKLSGEDSPAQPDPKTPGVIAQNLVRINGGTFMMGSPGSEVDRDSDEGPQHQVRVSGFWMGKYEVTQKEYQEVMGKNPSHFKGDNLPVEQVSWYDAVEYCNARSVKEGLTPAYRIDKSRKDPNNKSDYDGVKWVVTWDRNANGYRLPTEAEWEYACRAGTTTPFSTGNNITTSQANYDGNYPYNNNPKGIYREKTTPVGSFAPNPWGLYDMHGNVWEWCWDWYGAYSSDSATDPSGASSGSTGVLRGGRWGSFGRNLRSASRSNNVPAYGYNSLGFRVARP